jgi:hypothetical protein
MKHYEPRSRGLIARAMLKLHLSREEPEPVEDEADVEPRERIRSAGELTTPVLNEPGGGRWGYGLGDAGGDDVGVLVGEHAATIRAIARFGLHETKKQAAATTEPAKPGDPTREPK